MNGVTGCLVELIGRIRTEERRYPTVLVVERAGALFPPGAAEAVCSQANLLLLDVPAALFPQGSPGARPGVFSRGHFTDWIRREARKTAGVFLAEADWVIDGWVEADRRAFFLEFLRTECGHPDNPCRRIPIVLPTRNAARFSLPTEPTGQGIVFDLGGHDDQGEARA